MSQSYYATENIRNFLLETLKISDWPDFRNSYDECEAFITALAKKKKSLRGNNKPHITKPLSQARMKLSKIENKANKTKLLTDISNHKKLQNYVVNLTKV